MLKQQTLSLNVIAKGEKQRQYLILECANSEPIFVTVFRLLQSFRNLPNEEIVSHITRAIASDVERQEEALYRSIGIMIDSTNDAMASLISKSKQNEDGSGDMAGVVAGKKRPGVFPDDADTNICNEKKKRLASLSNAQDDKASGNAETKR